MRLLETLHLLPALRRATGFTLELHTSLPQLLHLRAQRKRSLRQLLHSRISAKVRFGKGRLGWVRKERGSYLSLSRLSSCALSCASLPAAANASSTSLAEREASSSCVREAPSIASILLRRAPSSSLSLVLPSEAERLAPSASTRERSDARWALSARSSAACQNEQRNQTEAPIISTTPTNLATIPLLPFLPRMPLLPLFLAWSHLRLREGES